MKKKLMVRCMTAAMCMSIMAGAAACGRTDSAAPASATEASAKAESSAEIAAPTGTADKTEAPSADASQEELVGADPSTWSPFTDCESLSEAEAAVGFKMTIPESIDGYENITYAAMKEYHLIQVQFEADEDHYITIRKAVDEKDISGDYNVYNETSTATVDGMDVTFKGNNGNICLATWTSGEYSYSIMCADLTDSNSSSHGLSVSQMTALVAAVR